MKQSIKQQRAMEKALAWIASAGGTVDIIEKVKEELPAVANNQQAVSRQLEAVLLFLESPAKFTKKICKWCGESFGTNYRYVSYCCDNCRAKALQNQTGIRYDFSKPQEHRWGSEMFPKEPPLLIPHAALLALEAFFQSQTEIHQSQSQSQSAVEEPLDSDKQSILVHTSPQPLPDPEDPFGF